MKIDSTENLDLEYLASKILSGILYPSEYTQLRSNFAKLCEYSYEEYMSQKLITLCDKITSKFGTLEDKEIENYYYGKNPELYSLVQSIQDDTHLSIQVHSRMIDEKLNSISDELEQSIPDQDYAGMGILIDQASSQNQEIQRLDKNKTNMRTVSDVLQDTLNLYASSNIKLPKKTIETKLNSKYLLFLQYLSQNLDNITNNTKLAMIIGNCIGSISQIKPQDDLDPFNIEKANNLIESLTNPKDFYQDCKLDRIVSSDVGKLFAKCYPEFYNKFMDMYLDEYDKLTYQEQISFRNCFGVGEDSSSLLSLTSNYIKLVYTQ